MVEGGAGFRQKPSIHPQPLMRPSVTAGGSPGALFQRLDHHAHLEILGSQRYTDLPRANAANR